MDFVGVARGFEVCRVIHHVLAEVGGKEAKAIDFGLIEVCSQPGIFPTAG